MFGLLAKLLVATLLVAAIVFAVYYSFVIISVTGLPGSPGLDFLYFSMVALGFAVIVAAFIHLRRR